MRIGSVKLNRFAVCRISAADGLQIVALTSFNIGGTIANHPSARNTVILQQASNQINLT
ncbi:hypothetical protein D3C77_795070 [compost metagenome]